MKHKIYTEEYVKEIGRVMIPENYVYEKYHRVWVHPDFLARLLAKVSNESIKAYYGIL